VQRVTPGSLSSASELARLRFAIGGTNGARVDLDLAITSIVPGGEATRNREAATSHLAHECLRFSEPLMAGFVGVSEQSLRAYNPATRGHFVAATGTRRTAQDSLTMDWLKTHFAYFLTYFLVNTAL